ncbi:MAG: hypothetical protein ACRELA_09350 [Candidatus Rokuibacteriota bacterium]
MTCGVIQAPDGTRTFNSTHLLATLAYQTAILGGKIGEGLAISSFMFPLLVVVIFLQLHFLRRAQE